MLRSLKSHTSAQESALILDRVDGPPVTESTIFGTHYIWDIQPVAQRPPTSRATHIRLSSSYSNLNTTSSKPVRLYENDYIFQEKITVHKSEHRQEKI